MDVVDGRITVSHTASDDDDLPPPPPVPPRPLDYNGPSSGNPLPPPPPKETFSTYYQQRQKSELKRLFKHIHPDLKASLDDVAEEDLLRAVQQDIPQAAEGTHQCEVQSMKWIFENWNLDNIGDRHGTKKLLEEEDLTGGDVRATTSKFEQTDLSQAHTQRQASVCGDVRTSAWLFETQPLDALNISVEGGELVEALLKEPIQPGDVKGNRLLFESTPLSHLGRCNSLEDCSFLKLKSELQEQKGDIQKTLKLFQADPNCAIKDNSGNIHKIKSICREEINSSNISTARWLFETQPLDLINKETDQFKIIRGISLEEGLTGGVGKKRWMFETQPIDTIHEMMGGDKLGVTVINCATDADVLNKTKLFETNPLSSLKGDNAEKTLEKEDIMGGDVKSSLWLFETQPMDSLHDNYEIGRLQKITLSAEEQGEVKDKKHIFENSSIRTKVMTQEQGIEKGDVKTFKHLFETIPLNKIAHSEEHKKNNTVIETGNVHENKEFFERTNLYAIKDSSGNLHKVTAISREESVTGQVQNYKWLFETKLLDELAERKGRVEVIKGITRQEDTMGDVKTAKWLFETQTIDGIHMKFNQPNGSANEEQHRGDVKTCKWLFETHPMDLLYDKGEKAMEKETIDSTRPVKSITWMFESQPLDSIRDGEQYNLNLCSTIQDAVKPEVGVQTVKHLFETETLDRIKKDAHLGELHCVSQVDLQSGDVSRVKELFESQSLDEIGLEITSFDSQKYEGSIEKGSVHKVTWLFDNCPLNNINKHNEEEFTQKVGDEEYGDVKHKKFIFETSSLEKIHEEELEQKSVVMEKPTSSIDVKTSTMMFESTPLYAIRDKEGQFHEVTTVKKEEVLSGDVRAARWMFETKPLDTIKDENEVYVIRAVTQEDVEKGDVKSARWKFETQPLDTLTDKDTPVVEDFEEFGSGNVQQNKQIFESDQDSKKLKRMVSVTDVQRGDVRTSTWLFENKSIDSLKGECEEQSHLQTVHREDNQKGDVKRCTWLFESQPLDKIKIKEQESSSVGSVVTELPKSDVKCTTWLFETTPLDKITATNVVDSLSYLHELNFVHSSGIIIERKDNHNVNMARYGTESNRNVQIHKEEVVRGNVSNIMKQLLLKETLKPQITLLREVEKGNVKTTVIELPVYQSSSISFEKDQRIQNILQRIDELLSQDKNFKRGLIMQETEDGQAQMSVYSLINHCETKSDATIEKGDVKSTIGNLLATANGPRTTTYKVDENEKGNVNLYKRYIEEGDLKSLHAENFIYEVDNCHMSQEQIEIVQGDVKEAKRSLCQQKGQVDRTVSDVLPGDVKNTKKMFSSESSLNVDNSIPKDEIIPGDILMAKQQLALKQQSSVEKEEIVSGDIKAAMQSLQRAKQQSMSIEREVIEPGTIYDMDLSSPDLESESQPIQKEVIVSGDVKAAKKSLEMAKQQRMNVEREVVVPGKIYNLNISTQEETSTTMSSTSSSRYQQIKTNPKVSDSANHKGSNGSFEFDELNSVLVSNSMESLPKYECNGHNNENETGEVIRGDIKAAIRSLQSAVSEQKSTDKENIVRGNVQLALQSLERSSVNVSKGDYKAAMIYRNSGRSKTATNSCVEMPMPSSDTKLSPSISVTHEEASTIAPSISLDNFQLPSCTNTVSALPTSSEKPHHEKPALPPKPQRTLMEEESISSDSVTTYDASTSSCPMYDQSAAAPVMDELYPKMNTQEIEVSSSQPDEVPQYQINGIKMEQTQKINAAEEIQTCMMKYAEEGNHETNLSVKAALQNFERKDDKRSPVVCKKVKVTDPKDTDSSPHPKFPPSLAKKQDQTETQKLSSHTLDDACNKKTNNARVEQQHHVEKVVLRGKKVRETEEQRRQRLSVHMDEIVKENVEVAMEIFDNLRKRDELQGVLDKVHVIEGDRRSINDKSLKKLYKEYPVWAAAETNAEHETMDEKFEADSQEDIESISSVDTAYEDLEKASKEILLLKEQTIARLLDIEETIKKALYSVSSLKSEADIAGLSGLFDETLRSEQHPQPTNNIRKISIGSCRSKPGPNKQSASTVNGFKPGSQTKPTCQSSPSFISIHSAARKPAEQPKPTITTFTPTSDQTHCRHKENSEASRNPPQRKISVLEVKTGQGQPPAGLIGKKTVSETYEETDGFGNVFMSSTTSTYVHKKSDNQSSALFEVLPPRREMVTSPLMHRRHFEDQVSKGEGNVFVTFSPSMDMH